ncbi:MAG: hypothetical protein JW849_06985 [Phycisphaerae bacterium]|nr:hypothetical protein [Phycisphaerae bacterium]
MPTLLPPFGPAARLRNRTFRVLSPPAPADASPTVQAVEAARGWARS